MLNRFADFDLGGNLSDFAFHTTKHGADHLYYHWDLYWGFLSRNRSLYSMQSLFRLQHVHLTLLDFFNLFSIRIFTTISVCIPCCANQQFPFEFVMIAISKSYHQCLGLHWLKTNFSSGIISRIHWSHQILQDKWVSHNLFRISSRLLTLSLSGIKPIFEKSFTPLSTTLKLKLFKQDFGKSMGSLSRMAALEELGVNWKRWLINISSIDID